MIYADLHTHTTCSDGTFSPEGLVSLARLRGLKVIAITDHDTIDGIGPAITAGEYYDIDVLPGVELSCEYNGCEVHLLGYFIDVKNPDLLSILSRQRLRRERRMEEMVYKLSQAGIKISFSSVLRLAEGGVVGRPHLAKLLVGKGYASDLKQVYRDFIGYHSPYYVATERLPLGEAIDVIVSSGGLPVLAHPVFISTKAFAEIIKDFSFWGIEVYYPEHSPRFISQLEAIAREKSLTCTGGSDFHGAAKKEDYLGRVGLTEQQAKVILELEICNAESLR